MTATYPNLFDDLEARITYIERTLSVFGTLMILTSLLLLLASLWRQNARKA